jgi:hypothetical protein
MDNTLLGSLTFNQQAEAFQKMRNRGVTADLFRAIIDNDNDADKIIFAMQRSYEDIVYEHGHRWGNCLVTTRDIAKSFEGEDMLYYDHRLHTKGLSRYLKIMKKYDSDLDRYAVVVGPYRSVSISDLFEHRPNALSLRCRGEIINDHVGDNIMVIRTEYSESINKKFDEQLALIPEKEYLPRAIWLVWFLLMSEEVYGKDKMRMKLGICGKKEMFFRTESKSSIKGMHTAVVYGGRKIKIISVPDGKASENIGMLSAIYL